MELVLKDVRIKEYNVNGKIKDYDTYIVYGKDINIINDFLKMLAGINRSEDGKILYNDRNVFDNNEYFNERLYLNMHLSYLNTMIPSVIKETLYDEYNTLFDESIFKKYINLLNVRKEVKIEQKYIYSDIGKSLLNYCFLRSLTKDNLIINDLFHNINNQDRIGIIINDILTYITKVKIISVDKLDYFINKPVKYIMFGDFNEVIFFDPKIDKLIITKDDVDLKNKMFKIQDEVICKLEGNEFLKTGLFKKKKYHEIGINDIIKIRGKYETSNIKK